MIRKIYHNSPPLIKQIARNIYEKIVPFPYVYGIQFAKFYKFLMKSQWWPTERLEEFQNERLRIIVKHAYENVPYYRRIFDERGLKPEDIKTKEDLKLLPILTKDDVRKNFNELLAKNYRKFNPILCHTSGSTGQPLSYYIDRDLAALIRATVWRHWQWCGIKHGELIAVFRGTLIDEFGKKRRCYYKVEGNQIHFSTFEMDEKIMTKYIQKLNQIKPALIRGYPASLEILARFIKEKNLSVYSPKAIHTSSEVVLPYQRKIIEDVFGAPLFDWYGHGESTICAGECEYHKGLHLNLEFGYTEFIKTKETENMKNVYNIISTSLWNFSMPFIRYDTEDLALLDNSKCLCRRGLPLIKKIIGRQADIIVGINGVWVSPSSFVHFWKYKIADKLSGILYAQIVQENKDFIRVKLVGNKSKENENIIREQLKMLLGNMKIEFDYLHKIPTGQKWRFTVSKIKEDVL
ncbi:MAG: phenylacetate--CoA ligase family protein [Thermoplasmata archaeon]|nr:phenylacetate--CoA ligase family protein [Thermoplasmata archaeon]